MPQRPKALDTLELKLQKVESHPKCVLRTELGSSASRVHALSSPCGVPDSERRKMKEMFGVSVHESNGFQPHSGSAPIPLTIVRALGKN